MIRPIRSSIDLEEYRRLRPDVRMRFDEWLKAEGLRDMGVVKLTIGEGAVTVVCCALDEKGKRYLGEDGLLAKVTKTVPIRTLPLREAFE